MRLGKQITAWSGLAALLAASICAPLFHVHSGGEQAPLVHAHFPELESSEDESVVHMEPPHSHMAARSIDFLITIAGQTFDFFGILPEAAITSIAPAPSRGFVPVASPRAHAPPSVRLLPPRAPPA